MRKAALILWISLAVFGMSRAALAADMDKLAKCISDSGARYYGAHWCSACAAQNRVFGTAARHLPYVECSAKGSRERLARCKNVPAFPTWVFSDGAGRSGVLSPELLAEYTHCKRPGGR